MSRRHNKQHSVMTPAQHGELTAPENSLYFNERDFQNYGKFVPFLINYGHSLSDANVRVNEYARRNQVDQSRNFAANIPEVAVAMQRLADFTVGTALEPEFNGTDQVWADTITGNFLNSTLSNLTRLGIAADWQSVWQLVLKTVLTDGDLLMIPYVDRYGLPKLEFIEGHRIGSRDGSTNGFTKIKGGRYEGYDSEDGVIYASNGDVVGYQILQGDSDPEDYTISKANCFLIYSPFSFAKGRGIPILSAASRQARNLMDYQHYIPQIVKQEARVQLVETNVEGKAPAGRTAFSAYNQAVNPVNPANSTTTLNAVTEYTQAGIYYLKANQGSKLESFNSNRPSKDVRDYITGTQKEMLCALFPYQLLLSPETVGGPGARGLKEILVASINTHKSMIEKWAGVALRHVLSVGMSNPSLQATFNFQTNFKEDYTNWSFTKAPEPSLDPGYERAADIADLNAGLTSPQAIVAKEGKCYADVLREINVAVEAKAQAIEEFQKKHPSLAAYGPQLFGLKDITTPQQIPAES